MVTNAQMEVQQQSSIDMATKGDQIEVTTTNNAETTTNYDVGITGADEVKIMTNDGVELCISLKAAEMSNVFKDMLVDREEDDEDPIPVEVNSRIMKYVIEYMEFHNNNRADEIPKPIPKDKTLLDFIGEWDKTFICDKIIDNPSEENVKKQFLAELLTAANYLQIKDLIALSAAGFAYVIRQCGTTEKIREVFGIINDFTPEEEKKITEENRFCDDD